MITSIATLRKYLAADMAASGIPRWNLFSRWRYPVMAFQRHLRRTEFALNVYRGPFAGLVHAFVRWRLREHGIRLGFTIPPQVFGPGLSIAHWGTIVVNENCRVGSHCRIHPGVCLGWARGAVPALGSHCYLGPGAKVFGAVLLGDQTVVGANAVVSRSYPAGHVTLVGVPAHPSNEAADLPEPRPGPAFPPTANG